MTDRIRVGAMLLDDGAHKPESLVIETEACLANWSYVVASSSSQLGRQIEAAGWTFFYMAGEINRRGFGFNDQSRSDRALAELIAAVKNDNCNCLEITNVTRGSFLWLPYTKITAHARHIQKSRSFYDLSSMPAKNRVCSREWLYDHPRPLQRLPAPGVALEAWENEGGSRAGRNKPRAV